MSSFHNSVSSQTHGLDTEIKVISRISQSSSSWLKKTIAIDKSNFNLGELVSTELLETLSELLEGNTLSTDLGEKETKRVRFLCDNKNQCKIAHIT